MTADPSTHALSLSRYKLLRQLGEGGVGKVFVALDVETGEQVAAVAALRDMGISDPQREICGYYLELARVE